METFLVYKSNKVLTLNLNSIDVFEKKLVNIQVYLLLVWQLSSFETDSSIYLTSDVLKVQLIIGCSYTLCLIAFS